MFVAGNETTTSLITNSVWRMFQLDLWQDFVEDRFDLELAITESLRFDPPLLALFRDADLLTGYVLAPGGVAVAGSLLSRALAPVSILFLLLFLAAFLSLFAQRVFVVAPEKLQPKLNRISPISQAKNKFGINGLVEFAKTTLKMSLVAVVVLMVLYGERERIVAAIYLSPGEIGAEITRLILLLLASVAAIAVVIAVPDYLWQRFSHMKKLRMSHEEMREEVKQTEGDPHLKSERRQRGQEIAANRMLLDVPKADVIIVNPTHYAVALKWNRFKGSAPVCVAHVNVSSGLKPT